METKTRMTKQVSKIVADALYYIHTDIYRAKRYREENKANMADTVARNAEAQLHLLSLLNLVEKETYEQIRDELSDIQTGIAWVGEAGTEDCLPEYRHMTNKGRERSIRASQRKYEQERKEKKKWADMTLGERSRSGIGAGAASPASD